MSRPLLNTGQPANAISDFTKAIELNPRDATTLGNRGMAYARIGKTVEAKKDLQEAVELDPALREMAKTISDKFELGL